MEASRSHFRVEVVSDLDGADSRSSLALGISVRITCFALQTATTMNGSAQKVRIYWMNACPFWQWHATPRQLVLMI
jgi:hypothetical protein